MLGSMKPCCARPNIPLHLRHGRRERISQMREAGRALCPRQIARLRCHEMSRWLGYAFCSKVPQSVDSHKGALGVRGLLRDASIYRPSNRREAEREAANRFAGIRPMLPNALCPAAANAAMSGRAPRSRRRGSTQHLLVQAPLPVDMPAESSEIACRAAAHPRIGRPGAGKAACLAFRLPPSRLADAQCNVPCPGRRGPSIYRKGRNAPSSLLQTPDMCRM